MDLTLTQCRQIAQAHPGTELRDIVEFLNDTPAWFPEPMTFSQLQAVRQGGCASGAYMPAVRYATAMKTMGEHGDEVLDHVYAVMGEVPGPTADQSWGQYCCFLLSTAVELWCMTYDFEGVNWE